MHLFRNTRKHFSILGVYQQSFYRQTRQVPRRAYSLPLTSIRSSRNMDKRLALLEELPHSPKPVGLYAGAVVANGFVHVSGQVCSDTHGKWITGTVGRDLTAEEGRQAARRVALAILATLEQAVGSLKHVKKLVKTLGMVNAVPDFTRQPYVIDGYAQVMKLVFGDDDGIGARSAVGFGSLPGGVPVEIEAIFEVQPGFSLEAPPVNLELKVDIPDPISPVGLYRPSVISGNFIYISGLAPQNDNGDWISGRVGQDLTLEEAQDAARRCGLAILSELRNALGGSLKRVKRLVKSFGMVNAGPDFGEHPKVINGYSQVMKDVFGQDAGVAARCAVGMSSLPFNVPVEIEAIFEIEPVYETRIPKPRVAPETRLNELGIVLPELFVPKAMYSPAVVSNGYCYVSGHGTPTKGKIGDTLTTEEGHEEARLTALRVLSRLKATVGSLNRVKRIVKTYGMVNADPSFTKHPKVIDGFSEVMRDVFGEEDGVGARSAVGLSSLPGGMPVEIEAIFEVDNLQPKL